MGFQYFWLHNSEIHINKLIVKAYNSNEKMFELESSIMDNIQNETLNSQNWFADISLKFLVETGQ